LRQAAFRLDNFSTDTVNAAKWGLTLVSWRKQIRIHVYSRLKALSAKSDVDRYLRSTSDPMVNVGCGKNILPGWLNTDLYPHVGAIQMNAAQPWPVPQGIVAAVLCEQMIEHVPKSVAQNIALAAFRALRPGGALRIVTPDLTKMAEFALNGTSPDATEYVVGLRAFKGATGVLTVCDAINDIFYEHGHRYIYTQEELITLLRSVGFTDFSCMRGGQYENPFFEGVDGHPKIIGQRMNEIEAVAVEARKSA
jgi:hypothetical protein